MQELTKKILLLGRLGVGKTSMVNRFVHDRFSDTYYSTIGVRIEKKSIAVSQMQLNLVIWDIAGESSQKNTPQSYFLGAHGIIYLLDVTAPSSYENLTEEIDFVKQRLPGVPYLVVANKTDLLQPNELAAAIQKIPVSPDLNCSAKNNINVDNVFMELGRLILLNP